MICQEEEDLLDQDPEEQVPDRRPELQDQDPGEQDLDQHPDQVPLVAPDRHPDRQVPDLDL